MICKLEEIGLLIIFGLLVLRKADKKQSVKSLTQSCLFLYKNILFYLKHNLTPKIEKGFI